MSCRYGRLSIRGILLPLGVTEACMGAGWLAGWPTGMASMILTSPSSQTRGPPSTYRQTHSRWIAATCECVGEASLPSVYSLLVVDRPLP